MGQEWAASSPFLFFTDHHAELGRLVTEGRREEFRSFAAFADPARRAAIPDPQAAETFTRSRLPWDERSRQPHAGTQRLYQRLLDLRRREEAFITRTRERCSVQPLDDHTIALYHPDAPLLIVARLSGGAGRVRLDVTGTADAILSTEDADVTDDGKAIGVSDLRTGEAAQEIEIRFERPGAIVMRAASLAFLLQPRPSV
jgi:maltooligosyltrehalose trehalohydrolase